MADNLSTTIGISADTSKARADIKLLSEQVKDFGRQVSAAVKAGDTARATQLSQTYGTMADRLSTLRRGLSEVGSTGTRAFNDIARSAEHADSAFQSFIHSGRGLGRVVSEFATMSRGLESITGILGTLTGGFLGGFVGVAVARAIDGVINQLDEMEKKLVAIRDLGRTTGTPPIRIQAMQDIVKGLGESADIATAALTRMSETEEKARTQMGPAGGVTTFRGTAVEGIGGSDSVLRGAGVAGIGNAAATADGQVKGFTSSLQNGVNVLKAGAPVLIDFNKPLAIIGVNLSQFRSKAEQDKAILVGFMQQVKAGALDLQQLNAISKDLFNVPLEAMIKIAPALIAQLDKKIAELKAAPRGATPERLDTIAELNKAKKELDDVLGIEDIQARILDWWHGVQIATNRGLTEFIGKTLPAFFTDIVNEINRIWQDGWNNLIANTNKAYNDFTTVWQPLADFFRGLATSITAAWDGVLNKIKEVGAAVQNALSDFPGAPVATAEIPPPDRGRGAQPSAQPAQQWAQLTKSVTENTKITVGNIEGAFSGLASWSAQMAKSMVSVWNAAMQALKRPDTGDWSPKSDDTSGVVLGGRGAGKGGKLLSQDPESVGDDYWSPEARHARQADMQAEADRKQAVRDASGYVDPPGTRAISSGPTTWREIPSGPTEWRPFASGGYIRGPGSGTSDSILARLSNGEFVLNAGSVRRLGVGFLQGLNSFASGGLVMPRSLPSFAAGGAVSSPAGFTIVIGGHSFGASTDNATAASLARVARSQSMRSAGRKPGWAN